MAHRVQLRARDGQHFAYAGRALLVTNLHGLVTGAGVEGFYFENTRFLNRLALCVHGREPRAVAASPAGGDRLLAYFELAEAPGIPGGSVYVTLDAVVDVKLTVRMRVENFDLENRPCHVPLGIELGADFADSDEAEKGRRRQEAPVDVAWDAERNSLRFDYRHPNLRRATAVHVASGDAKVRCDGSTLTFPVELAGRGAAEVTLEAEPLIDGGRTHRHVSIARTRARLESDAPRVFTSNDVVARAWRTAVADLASLPFGDRAGPAAPIAGLPLYQQFFGRDTLTAAWQAGLAMPSMLRDALTANAAMQGHVIDDRSDEEPGKLIHQSTRGPLATLGITNNRRNFGDYATAPDFLIMLGQYLAWTNDVATVRKLMPAARRVIDWIARYADLDDDGLIEYRTRSPQGIKNQGWKDADDAIVDERGRVIEPPIATVELQAYTYAGLQQAALAFAAAGDRAFALDLLSRARRLRRLIDERFWMPGQGFYAMALGPDKKQVTSISSNPAHLLACGVASGPRAREVAARLMKADMFSGWGIRTLSSAHPAYNPFSYHRGSVWPVENGTAALGFARYGLWQHLHALAEGVFSLTDLFEEGRLPEAVGGVPRDDMHPHPGIYPASCEPQAWSASMIVLLVQSIAGMLPVAPLHLVLVDPHLPEWLPDLRLHGMQVGHARVDLDMWRTPSGRTRYSWRADGPVRVVRQPPPQARAGAIERILSALSSLA